VDQAPAGPRLRYAAAVPIILHLVLQQQSSSLLALSRRARHITPRRRPPRSTSTNPISLHGGAHLPTHQTYLCRASLSFVCWRLVGKKSQRASHTSHRGQWESNVGADIRCHRAGVWEQASGERVPRCLWVLSARPSVCAQASLIFTDKSNASVGCCGWPGGVGAPPSPAPAPSQGSPHLPLLELGLTCNGGWGMW
jgi:hypothetical protein